MSRVSPNFHKCFGSSNIHMGFSLGNHKNRVFLVSSIKSLVFFVIKWASIYRKFFFKAEFFFYFWLCHFFSNAHLSVFFVVQHLLLFFVLIFQTEASIKKQRDQKFPLLSMKCFFGSKFVCFNSFTSIKLSSCRILFPQKQVGISKVPLS